MKRIRKLIFSAALAFGAVATPVTASNWYEIGGGTYYSLSVDLETIEWNGPVVTYWDKWVSTKPGDNLDFAKGRSMINCQTRMRRSLFTVEYYRDGTNGSSSLAGEWKPIIPDTSVDGMREFICKRRPRGK
ncbi:surface-adhesin E family protein [Sphingobium yanoikuyae]|uniref:surface-adhesin E family protein n=1 Tax=Sphingobium yanoikuyae TaxID=13690 RepID=UPI0031DECB97